MSDSLNSMLSMSNKSPKASVPADKRHDDPMLHNAISSESTHEAKEGTFPEVVLELKNGAGADKPLPKPLN